MSSEAAAEVPVPPPSPEGDAAGAAGAKGKNKKKRNKKKKNNNNNNNADNTTSGDEASPIKPSSNPNSGSPTKNDDSAPETIATNLTDNSNSSNNGQGKKNNNKRNNNNFHKIQELEKKLKESEAKLHETEAKLAETAQPAAAAEDSNAAADAAVAQIEDLLAKLQEESRKSATTKGVLEAVVMKGKVLDATVANLQKELESANATVATLVAEKGAWAAAQTAQLADLTAENADLKERLKTVEMEAATGAQVHKERADALQAEKEVLDALVAKGKVLDATVNNLQKELEHANATVATLLAEKEAWAAAADLTAENADLKQRLQSAEAEATTGAQEHKERADALQVEKEMLDALVAKGKVLDATVANQKKELEHANATVATLLAEKEAWAAAQTAENADLKQRLQSAEAEATSGAQEHKERADALQAEKEVLDALVAKGKVLDATVANQQKELEHANATVATLLAEKGAWAAARTAEVADLTAENADLKQRLQTVETEAATGAQEHKERADTLQSEKDVLSAIVQRLQKGADQGSEALQKARERANTLESEKDVLSAIVQRLQKDASEGSEVLQREMDALKGKLESLEEENGALKEAASKLQKEEAHVAELLQKLADTHSLMDQVVAKGKVLEATVVQLQKEKTELIAAKQETEDALSQVRSAESLPNYEEMLQALRDELTAAKENFDQDKAQLEDTWKLAHDAQMQEAKEQLASLEQQLKDAAAVPKEHVLVTSRSLPEGSVDSVADVWQAKCVAKVKELKEMGKRLKEVEAEKLALEKQVERLAVDKKPWWLCG